MTRRPFVALWGYFMKEVGTDRLLTVKEACDLLRVGRTTFGGMVRRSEIRPVRIGPTGRSLRIPCSEIDRYVEARCGEGARV